jgi:YHS domain-containing protein
MKNLFYLAAIAFTTVLSSCNTEQKTEKTSIESTKIDFASDKDPVCQMSVKGKVGDTTNYKGKVYGFCNPGCKEEFVKNPDQYIK